MGPSERADLQLLYLKLKAAFIFQHNPEREHNIMTGLKSKTWEFFAEETWFPLDKDDFQDVNKAGMPIRVKHPSGAWHVVKNAEAFEAATPA